MDNFFRILGEADLARTPLVLDLELDHGYSAARITAETTGIAVSPYRKEGLTCLAEIRKLMELGTQNRRLVLSAVTPQRQLRFYEQPRPDQPDLYMDSFSRFFNRQGALLPPWHPPVGRFARFSGTNRINHPWDRRRLPACFVAGAEFWPQTGKWRIRTVDGEPMLEK
jgi:hypothetical protein